LNVVGCLRYGAIAVLPYVEVRDLASLYWSVVLGRKSPDVAAQELSTVAGYPPQVAALLAKEAAFWQRLLAKPIEVLRGLRRK
jgi:hypothetical protein